MLGSWNTPLVHSTKNDLVKKLRRLASDHGEIIEFFGGTRHLSTILLKNFHLFKIVESVINFCLKKIYN